MCGQELPGNRFQGHVRTCSVRAENVKRIVVHVHRQHQTQSHWTGIELHMLSRIFKDCIFFYMTYVNDKINLKDKRENRLWKKETHVWDDKDVIVTVEPGPGNSPVVHIWVFSQGSWKEPVHGVKVRVISLARLLWPHIQILLLNKHSGRQKSAADCSKVE